MTTTSDELLRSASALCAKLREAIKPIRDSSYRMIPMIHVEEIARLSEILESQLHLVQTEKEKKLHVTELGWLTLRAPVDSYADHIARAVSERCGIPITDSSEAPSFSIVEPEPINEASGAERRSATATPDQQRGMGQSVCVTSPRDGLEIPPAGTEGEAGVAPGLASPTECNQ